MRRVVHHVARLLLILLALVFLFEAWLWEHLAPIVAWIVARLPLAPVKRAVAARIERLPPPAALVVFALPVILLLPLKLLAVGMLAHGDWLGALGVLALAKLMSVGVTAFIFDLTRDKLLQMAWFQRFYRWVMRGLAWAHAMVDPVKRRLRIWFRMFAPRRAGRTLKLIRRIRQRAITQAAS